jgi:nitroimidazol reductase NimA-like FMN-containing flavoprotein (pyridoxamine 5'-phosphate oxidase superfamily)
MNCYFVGMMYGRSCTKVPYFDLIVKPYAKLIEIWEEPPKVLYKVSSNQNDR